MDTIKVLEVQLAEPLAEAIEEFLSEAFGKEMSLAKILQQTASTTGHPSLNVAAFAGEKIVGFAVFMSQQIWVNGSAQSVYQAANVATSPMLRGRGIFQKIVCFAEETLRDRGGGFIFGFPNAMAYPVWTEKLGYRTVERAKLRAIMPFGLGTMFGAAIADKDKVVSQDEPSLIAAKIRTHGRRLIVGEDGNSRVWGVRREYKKYGIKLSFFDVGGIQFEDQPSLRRAFKKAWISARRPIAVRIETLAQPYLQKLFPGLVPFAELHNKMIVKDLNISTQGHEFAFFGGITDTF